MPDFDEGSEYIPIVVEAQRRLFTIAQVGRVHHIAVTHCFIGFFIDRFFPCANAIGKGDEIGISIFAASLDAFSDKGISTQHGIAILD